MIDYEKKQRLIALRDSMKEYGYADGIEELESIFPELRESEDERIRKEIIECIETLLKVPGATPRLCDWIAWLEKQKEPHYTKRNALFDKCVENCDPEVMKEVSDSVDEMLQKEQKDFNKLYEDIAKSEWFQKSYNGKSLGCDDEQKPAECADDVVEEAEEYTSKVDCGEYGVAVTEAYIAGVLSERNRKPAEWDELQAEFRSINEAFEDGKKEVVDNPKKYGLCKPAEWSEEDKKMRLACINTINEVIDYELNRWEDCTYRPVTKYDEQIDFLKSLHERFNLQPKQEWSEEDEHRITDAIYFLETAKSHYADTSELDATINFLKSLRPSWKPSEEQMSMLLAVLNDPNNAGAESCQMALKSLYEQLKKLM